MCTSQQSFPVEMPASVRSELVTLSTRLGRDSRLVHGNTGNVSIKAGDTLWIKASGYSLSQADREDMFVPVDMRAVRQGLVSTAKSSDAMHGEPGRRPSIETPMHVVMPHRMVIHVHSINCVAWAVRKDAEHQIKERLSGLNWKMLPYVESGWPLAEAIRRHLRSSCVDVFILGNHGVVIGSHTSEHGEALLREVEARLETPGRSISTAPKRPCPFSGEGGWLPGKPELHALASDPLSRAIACGGILFPTQATFLGRKILDAPDCSALLSQAEEYRWRHNALPRVALLERQYTMIQPDLSEVGLETLEALMSVVERIPSPDVIRYLTGPEIDQSYPYGNVANGSV